MKKIYSVKCEKYTKFKALGLKALGLKALGLNDNINE